MRTVCSVCCRCSWVIDLIASTAVRTLVEMVTARRIRPIRNEADTAVGLRLLQGLWQDSADRDNDRDPDPSGLSSCLVVFCWCSEDFVPDQLATSTEVSHQAIAEAIGSTVTITDCGRLASIRSCSD